MLKKEKEKLRIKEKRNKNEKDEFFFHLVIFNQITVIAIIIEPHPCLDHPWVTRQCHLPSKRFAINHYTTLLCCYLLSFNFSLILKSLSLDLIIGLLSFGLINYAPTYFCLTHPLVPFIIVYSLSGTSVIINFDNNKSSFWSLSAMLLIAVFLCLDSLPLLWSSHTDPQPAEIAKRTASESDLDLGLNQAGCVSYLRSDRKIIICSIQSSRPSRLEPNEPPLADRESLFQQILRWILKIFCDYIGKYSKEEYTNDYVLVFDGFDDRYGYDD